MEPRILFLLAPPERDPTGILRNGTRAQAAGYLKRGFLPLFQEANSPTLLDDIGASVASQNVKLIFSVGGWGLDAPPAGGKETVAAFSRFDIPVIHTISDSPFASWIIPKVRCGFPKRLAFTLDRSFVRYLESRADLQGHFVYGSLAVQDFSNDPLNSPRQIEDRDVEMLFAGVVLDFEGIRRRYHQRYPENKEVLDAIVETALWDYWTPLIDIGQEQFDTFGRPFDPLEEDTGRLLEMCDWIVRNRRRYEMLRQLAKHPMVIVTHFPQHLPAPHPDSKIIKNMRFDKLLTLTKRVKIMPMAQPTYTDGITERILYAMNYGCAVATSTNNEIERVFRSGEDLLLFNADFSNADEIIDRLRDPGVLHQLSENGRRAVKDRFSLDATVDRYIQAAKDMGLEA